MVDSLVEAHASSTQAATTQGLWPFALFIHEEFDKHTALTWGCATRDAREDAKAAGANNTAIKELDDEDISIRDGELKWYRERLFDYVDARTWNVLVQGAIAGHESDRWQAYDRNARASDLQTWSMFTELCQFIPALWESSAFWAP